jgi:acetyl-CoA acetyltransferase
MDDIVIVAAARTPVGSFNGAFASVPAHTLGAAAIQAAIARAGLEPGDVDEVILGQVLTAGQGQNPARQAARTAGVPDSSTAFGINQVCGSGLRAVALASQQIRSGESAIVVAGGQESMSQSQHAAYRKSLPDHPRRAGRLRARLAAEGERGAEIRPLQGRDHSGHHQGPQGRHGRRERRIHPPRFVGGGDGQAAPGLQQGRYGDRRQRERHQ